ncbi:MAG: S41 family peptidase [Gemmataceae bacterium]
MLRSLWFGLVAIFIGLASPISVFAAGTTHAVLVGVGTYSDPQIHTRPHAVVDAQAMYDLLVDAKTLGAPASQIHLLLSDNDEARHAQMATRENILSAVKEVVAKAGKDDLVVFAMFGQGAALADLRTCIFTTDSTFKERVKTALSTAELEKELEPLKSEKIVAFMDINYKGIDPGKEQLLEPNIADPARIFIGSEEKEEHTLPPGRVIFLSNVNISAPIVELEDHSLFAKVILDGLKGGADKDGYEPDGNVTVDELATYIDANVADLLRKAGRLKDEKWQTPYGGGSRATKFVLTHNPAVYAAAHERVEKLAKSQLPADVAAEGEKLLSRMPRLKSDQELRKLYQQTADGKLSVDNLLAARTKNYDGRKLPVEDAKIFARRTLEGMALIERNYVKETNTGKLTAWAIKGMYKRLDLKMPDDIKEQLDNLDGQKKARLLEILTDVRVRFGQREDLDTNKDVDVALTMCMLNLDFPYSMYIDKESKDKAEIDFRGRFTGIGIQIRRDLARDGLLVVSPIKDSPGYKAGLKAGDLVTEITTEMDDKGRPQPTPQIVSTKGMKTEDAVKRILGKAGTPVKVKVEREGVDHPLEFEIARGKVEVETVVGAKRNDDDSFEFMLDPASKIGYIRLTQFIDRSSADMETAVRTLVAQGMRGLVLDLRFNPGGLLDSAVEISDLFIDTGRIVGIRNRGADASTQKWIKKEGGPSFRNFPIACLVNGESASGSEIVAACLQDHERAVIVGQRSYGKGSVQTIHKFHPVDAEIKLTTATFWRPNEKNLNKPSIEGYDKMPKEELEKYDWGVRPTPGFELKLDRKEVGELYEHLRDREIIPRRDLVIKEPKPELKDRQLDMALEYLRSQIKTAARPPQKKAG